MQYRNCLTILCVFLLASFQLTAQKNSLEEKDITGLWKGFMYNDTTQQNYRYEIAISESKGKLYGYSHTYFILDDKQYHGVKKIKIKRDGNEITTEDVELIANNYPIKPPKGVHVLNVLKFEIKDTVMVLSGMFSTNRTREFAPATGYIHVERKNDYRQSALIPHLEELGLTKNLSFLKEENKNPPEETIAILKPIATAEEQKLIETAAKKQLPDNKIKPATAPAIVIKELPKPVEPVVLKPVPTKTAEPITVKTETLPKKTEAVVVNKPVQTKTPDVIIKPAPQKLAAPVVIKPVAPPQKTEVAVINKPVPAKIETPDIAKTLPAKIADPAVPKPVVIIKPDPVDATAATDAGKRRIENIQALYFKSDSLQLTLYDNGEVDGDTVSVIMNGKVIMPKVGLSTNAVKKTIYTQEAGDSIQLVMYAESLGSLPPNTGLLIVYDGNDRYEIRFSGDMQKSSAIVFRRRKD
jgi:hypothetical protein